MMEEPAARPDPQQMTTGRLASDGAATGELTKGGLAAGFALIAWSCPSVIAKSLPIAALPLVFFRGWLGVIWSLGFLLAAGGRLNLRVLRASFWGGVALGFDLVFFFSALKATTIANATVISALQPVLLIFLAPMLFKERVRWADIAAAAVAIAGVMLVVSGSSQLSAWSLRGDVFAALALFAWTGYLVASKRARESVNSTEFAAAVTLIAALIATPLVLLSDQPLHWPEPAHWIGLVAIAILGWAGHVLMNWALAYLPLWVGGTSALGIPVLASALAAAFLDERLLPMQLVGMAVVAGSLTVVGLRSPRVLGPAVSA